MKLSIIILSYNTKALTLSCLKSLDKYPYDEKFEVLVVDNGSSDDSVAALKKYKPKNYNLILIENNENSGFSKGNNIGINKARGEYILLLNSDTEVTKWALDSLVSYAENHADTGVVAPKLLNKDRTLQASVYKLPTVFRALKHYVLRQGKLDKYAPNTEKPTEVESVVGAAFLITPKARKKAGLLDERYFMYFEDLDYCRKVRQKNLKVYYVPTAEVIHIHGASGKANPRQAERLINSSKIYHGIISYYLITALIKIGRRLSPSMLILALAIFGAIVIRFLYFPDNIYFAYDQARDAFRAGEIMAGDFKLLGPTASINGLFHGPLYWYLLAPLYFLFNGSVVYVAGIVRLFNVLSVVLIYLIGKTIAGKRVGLMAAVIYAFSFENWQEAQYFTNPGPAVITSLIFYLSLARIIKGKDKILDWLLLALGLGLSIQLQFYLVYQFIPFVLGLFVFRNNIIKGVSAAKITIFSLGLVSALSTFIVSELKFNFRISRSLAAVLVGRDSSDPLISKLSQWFYKVGLTISDSLGVSHSFSPYLLVFLFFLFVAIAFIFSRYKAKQAILLLAIWVLSTLFLYVIVGHNTYYIIGLSAGIILLFSVSLENIAFLKLCKNYIVIGVVVMNLFSVVKQARAGIVTQISVQEGMRYGDEKAVVDYIYQDSSSREVVLSALTMPYDIYTTWAYLFQNYGSQKYGYVPYWIREPVEGFPGRLPVSAHTICNRYTIYESARGLERLEVEFRKEQELTTKLINSVSIGKFTVEKRLDKACL